MNARLGVPDHGQIFTMSGYLCDRSQRALQRRSQKTNSANFAFWGFCEVRLIKVLGSSAQPRSNTYQRLWPDLAINSATHGWNLRGR
jgi:hypothetical protein